MRDRAVGIVGAHFPQSQDVEEVHVACQVAEPRQRQEPAVGGPGDGVAVSGAELVQ